MAQRHQLPGRRVVGNLGAAILVHEIAPHTLQESVDADHVARVPRLGGIQRPHEHFIQSQGIASELGYYLIRANGILEALAHLAVLTGHRLALPGELPVVQVLNVCRRITVLVDHLFHRYRDSTAVTIGVCLDVSLVEQLAKGLGRGHMAQVK